MCVSANPDWAPLLIKQAIYPSCVNVKWTFSCSCCMLHVCKTNNIPTWFSGYFPVSKSERGHTHTERDLRMRQERRSLFTLKTSRSCLSVCLSVCVCVCPSRQLSLCDMWVKSDVRTGDQDVGLPFIPIYVELIASAPYGASPYTVCIGISNFRTRL